MTCPANTTTARDGEAACTVPQRAGGYSAPRYAVVVDFYVVLTGLDLDDVVVRVRGRARQGGGRAGNMAALDPAACLCVVHTSTPPHAPPTHPAQAGVADVPPTDIITNLLRSDTAFRFNISQGGWLGVCCGGSLRADLN